MFWLSNRRLPALNVRLPELQPNLLTAAWACALFSARPRDAVPRLRPPLWSRRASTCCAVSGRSGRV